MTTRTRPPWADKYLRFAAWTQDEFRNLLCGFPPHPHDDTPLPADTPVPTRQETADAFVGKELRRVDTDRHMRDAILAGHLKVLDPPDERLLEKITSHVTLEELEALRRAIAHDRSCSKAYRVAPDAAIRWAAPRRDLFPDFPFDDPQPSGGVTASDRAASDELKDHRRLLVRRALRKRGFQTRAALCLVHKEFTPDILRAVVNGDSRRADVASWTPKVLDVLSIAEADWNTA